MLWESPGFKVRQLEFVFLALPSTCHMALINLLTLSDPQFIHSDNGDKTIHTQGQDRIKQHKRSQYLVPSSYLLNGSYHYS